jgi:hypothetical protein
VAVVAAVTLLTTVAALARVGSVLAQDLALPQARTTPSQSVQAAQQTLTAQIRYSVRLPLLVAAKAAKAILLALELAVLVAAGHQHSRGLMATLRQLLHRRVTMAV